MTPLRRNGIHLVSATQVVVPQPKYERQFDLDGYTITILCDPNKRPLVYHWIMQETGDNELRCWGQEASEFDAEEAAKACVEYSRKAA